MLKKSLVVAAMAAFLATPALAAQEKSMTPQELEMKKNAAEGPKKYLGVAMAVALGLAAFGGAFGQGRAISAAVEAVARQPEAGPRIFLIAIIGLALIETLVIYVLLMWFIWNGKLDS